ncbi:MAG TPA: enoyl-CoA hydratase-related protein [Solirubrobacterales bacterium]|nr:enoyl-CoA hydratase-related protein [Solirubrobacterales bacterium]
MSPEIAPLPAGPPDLETIEIELEGELAILTLNRPDSFNSMSPEMIWELPIAFGWLADRAPVRAAVITGAGGAFCAGGDINWFKGGLDTEGVDISAEVRRGADVLHQAIIDLRRVPFPVIAAVNGPAAGAGFSLALACDLRIASENAVFACAYGRIGASPDGGLTWLLPRAVGTSRALELLLNDPNLDAAAALAEGLVTEVVAADELAGRAREKAEKLGAMSPHYVRMCKRLVGESLDNSLAEHLQLERHGIADSLATEDARNGVTAFLAGGKPEFSGR